MATLSGFYGALAAALAIVGLYGIVSYMVARRRHELGIRMAVGADKRSILQMILREAIRSEEHTSELQSLAYLVCRLLLEKKNVYCGIRIELLYNKYFLWIRKYITK